MEFCEYLFTKSEPAPAWLQAFDVNEADSTKPSVLLQKFLQSRLVYYPGSGSDGGPVAAFNAAHAAHCFIYVDYLLERDVLLRDLQDAAFRGYSTITRFDLTERDFNLGRWKSHVTGRVDYPFPPVPPYGFIEILERDASHDQAHGAKRLAILFLAADGHAAYDAIFCQNNGTPTPFCVVVQDHGFGCGNSPFGKGGHLSQIASDCRVLPQYLLVGDNTDPWQGYQRCTSSDDRSVRGEFMGRPGHGRYLWERA